METLVFRTIGMAALGWATLTFLMSFELYQRLVIKWPKPFGCAMCFTFWVSIVYMVVVNGFNDESAMVAAIAAVIAEYIERRIVV